MEALYAVGVMPNVDVVLSRDHLPVMLDGRLVGRCVAAEALRAVQALRDIKASGGGGGGGAGGRRLPEFLEISWVPPRANGLWPGLFLFTSPGRMMRPVMQVGAIACVGWCGLNLCKDGCMHERRRDE